MPFLGIVGDSHIPGRRQDLPAGLETLFQGADFILHTGDISRPWVLRRLETIAPVKAVRGNSDLFLPLLPLRKDFIFQGVAITLTHSHQGMLGYLYERYIYFTRGYTINFHHSRVLQSYPKARIIIFGHTHYPYCCFHEGQLLFNPGSLGPNYLPNNTGPKAGRLFFESNHIRGEVVEIASGKTICSLQTEIKD